MDPRSLQTLTPFVRLVKISKSQALTGEWLDYDHVFTYIEQGEAVFVLNGVAYPVSQGDMVLMPPLMPHVIRSVSEQPLVQYIVHFDCYYDPVRSGWRTIGRGTAEQRRVPPQEQALASLAAVAHACDADQRQVTKRFLMMHQEYAHTSGPDPLLLKAGVLELLALFLRNQAGPREQPERTTKGWSVIEHCIRHMHEQYRDPALDNRKLAELTGVSVSHLAHLFREELGITLQQYRTHIRIEEAKRLMLDRRETLTHIAELTGFASIHQFSRTFRHVTGMTASRFMAIHSRGPHGAL